MSKSDSSTLDLKVINTNPHVNLKSDAIKRVFSTNVFIPMDPNLNNKSFMYFTGFVKLVETFKARTGFHSASSDEKWYLYVYYDSMFDEEYFDQDYEPTDNSSGNVQRRVSSLTRAFSFKQSGYEKLESNNNNNNELNTSIKTNYKKKKKVLEILHKLYKKYLAHIKANVDGEYNFIRLFSYKAELIKKDKGYLGHPKTFGTMVRFEPFYKSDLKSDLEPDLDFVFCINISHAITPNLMKLVEHWINQKDKDFIIFSLYSSGPIGQKKKNISKKVIQPLKELKILDLGDEQTNFFKFPAGIFGFKKKKYEEKLKNTGHKIFDYKELFNENTEYENYKYGIDEAILSYIIRKLFNDTHPPGEDIEKYCIILKDDEEEDTTDELKKTDESLKLFSQEWCKRNPTEQNLSCYKELSNCARGCIYMYIYQKMLHNDLVTLKISQQISQQIRQQIKDISTFQGVIALMKKSNEPINPIILKGILSNSQLDSNSQSDIFNKLLLQNHRLLGRELVEKVFGINLSSGNQYINIFTKYFNHVYQNPKEGDFISLLNGFDEVKPLIICIESDECEVYTVLKEYYTLYNITLGGIITSKSTNTTIEDADILFREILEYYQDPAQVLLEPYNDDSSTLVGGKRKYIKQNRKKRKLTVIKKTKRKDNKKTTQNKKNKKTKKNKKNYKKKQVKNKVIGKQK